MPPQSTSPLMVLPGKHAGLLPDELLELEELDELELLLELDELLDDELDEELPPHVAACGLLPLTVMESIFARPLAVVACNRMLFTPAFRFTATDPLFAQLVQTPVAANARGETAVDPFTSSMALRSPDALA
jgi:hypothetical protein